MNPDDESSHERGRRLRAESTPEEQKLWRRLRAKRFGASNSADSTILVLFCRFLLHRAAPDYRTRWQPASEREEKDAGRTAYLNEQGYRVVRFWNEQINAELDNVLELQLNQISAALPPQVHAAMITDGAGWHRSQALRIPANISLIDIPPATPECNPAEKPWQYLKDNFLSHRVFITSEDILDACQHAWHSMLAEAGRIASLTAMQHLLCQDT